MAAFSSPISSRRRFVYDRKSDQTFLCYTGSNVSILPASKYEQKQKPIQTFVGANGTKINAHGKKLVTLDFGLRRKFVFPFFICNTSTAILGADFLHEFNLRPNLRCQTLFANETKLQSHAHSGIPNISCVETVLFQNIISCNVKRFP